MEKLIFHLLNFDTLFVINMEDNKNYIYIYFFFKSLSTRRMIKNNIRFSDLGLMSVIFYLTSDDEEVSIKFRYRYNNK